MIPVRIIQPIRPILRLSPVLYKQFLKRYKSGKESGLTTATRSEVDTNVKPLGEKVKETTKTVSYLGVILIGVGVTGTLFYAVFRELFSSKSPNNIYTKAAKRCIADPRVEDKLGRPITAYGEETRRGRRQHVSHVEYMGKDGRRHLRMKFHLKGSFHTGTVQLDMFENDAGDYEYRYLFLEVDDMLRNTIVLEDNRHSETASRNTDLPSFDLKF
ncbi:hypothetical protein NQ315_015863 [Exocentrus adspersus]|uniref:Mitochondrial import inner membrane translocase subunit Tim21 n=1 Tax=Exocentrus adspersus TaxID=1586481 RepID=A0AAV8W4G6_9CUCU|nr:hypothetical protein NQ315_015863 [Exocentrus adspersus]